MSRFKIFLTAITIFCLLAFMLGVCYAEDAGKNNVVKILRTTNKAQVANYVPIVYTFTKVNPHEIVNYFTSALATEEGGAYSYLHPDQKSGKILVICPMHQIPYFDKLAKELDRENITSAAGSKYVYYRLKHRRADDAGLIDSLSVYGGLEAPAAAYGLDVETNSISLYDTPSGTDEGERILKEFLDTPTPQVDISLKIYEVDASNNSSLGLDYISWKNGPGKVIANAGYSLDVYRSEVPGNKTAMAGNYGYYINYSSAFFDWLASKNRAKIVANTRLTAMNGNQAFFSAGEKILYHSKDANNNLSIQGQQLDSSSYLISPVPNLNGDSSRILDRNPQDLVDVQPTGITVDLTPTIGSDRLNLDLQIRVADLIGYQDGGSPIISSRQMTDYIMIPYGQEVMVGNLSREYIVKAAKKIPILGSIPGLGWLFGGENDIKQKSTAIVSITASKIEGMSNITARDKKIMDVVAKNAEIESPEAVVGFDQWLLDSE